MLQIADLPSDADLTKPQPLDRFVNYLIHEQSVDLDCRKSLQIWAEAQGILLIEPFQSINTTLEAYLKIEVKLHSSGKYLVSAALIEDPDPLNSVIERTVNNIDISTPIDPKYAPGYSKAQLPDILSELIAICGSDYSIPLTDLNIQWFLPTDLMSLPIEHWQIQTGRKQQHCNGIRCKSAIVRSVDRNSQHYRSVLGEWKKNWKNLPTCPQSLCTDTLKNLDPMAGEREIDLSKPNVVGCKFIEHEDPQEQEDFWDELFSQGLPIALSGAENYFF